MKYCEYGPRGQYYKTVYGRYLLIFIISSSVCPCKPLQPSLFLRVRQVPNKHHNFLRKSLNYGRKSFIVQAPGALALVPQVMQKLIGVLLPTVVTTKEPR
jgi:hypothetical protein